MKALLRSGSTICAFFSLLVQPAQAQFTYKTNADGIGVASNAVEAVNWYRKAAEQGLPIGQRNLAICYEHGVGVASNAVEAVNWMRKAAEQGDAEAEYNLGGWYSCGSFQPSASKIILATYRKSTYDFVEAAKWFRKAAEQGLASGQIRLGDCYSAGYGVEKDYAEAVKWYHKAADQGDASAQRVLGDCYTWGHGVAEDYAEAVKWYHKAADQGDASAQRVLGHCFIEGHGVAKDYAEAIKWYIKSAELGGMVNNSIGGDVAKDYAEAVKWYIKSADLLGMVGNYMEQDDLSSMFIWDDAAATNASLKATAIELLTKSAQRGNLFTQNMLGDNYAQGLCVAANEIEAAKWYQKAAEQGDPKAQIKLGMLYATEPIRAFGFPYGFSFDRGGDDAAVVYRVEKNAYKAANWFRKAADAEQEKMEPSFSDATVAQYLLGLSYALGQGVIQDNTEAVKWFSKAAEGNVLMSLKVADYYAGGTNGVVKDATEAVKWYRKAADLGSSDAKSKLGTMYDNAARVQPRVSPHPTVDGNSAMKEGVPLTIYNAIAAAAAKEWPGNYEMQLYEIKNQLEAYKKLHQ